MARLEKTMFCYQDLLDLGERRTQRYLVAAGNRGTFPRSWLISPRVRVWWAHEVRAHYEKLATEGLAGQERRRQIAVKAAAKSVEVRRRIGLLPPKAA